jgi:hypothetical protein
MKVKKIYPKVAIATVIFIALSLIFVKIFPPQLIQKQIEAPQKPKEINITTEKIEEKIPKKEIPKEMPKPPPSPPVTNETLALEEGRTLPKGFNASKVVTLEIFDICSGKLEPGATVVEGGIIWCLNKKYPYYIIIEKNGSHIRTSFYGNVGFNETYEISDEIKIFYIYVQDIATVGADIKAIEFYGNLSNYFKIGNYTQQTIWLSSVGELKLYKMAAVIPLYITSAIPSTENWEKLDFYLKTSWGNYFIGDLWFYIKG